MGSTTEFAVFTRDALSERFEGTLLADPLLVWMLAELVEGELIDEVVEMELAGGLECMELVFEEEGIDGDGLDVDVLDVFEVCWANRKAGTRRTLAAKLDRRMEYLRIPSQELS